MAKLMLQGANLLMLDEPTNHLDIQSAEVLEESLEGYTGSLLMISHDRYFIPGIYSSPARFCSFLHHRRVSYEKEIRFIISFGRTVH